MKFSSLFIASLAIAGAASAHADSFNVFEGAQPVTSNRTRAEVAAEAVEAARAGVLAHAEPDYSAPAAAVAQSSTMTRSEVAAQAREANREAMEESILGLGTHADEPQLGSAS